MVETNFCFKCEHYDGGEFFSHCNHEKASGADLVTGIPYRSFCSTMRLTGNPCGPKGKLFSPAETKQLSLVLEEGKEEVNV